MSVGASIFLIAILAFAVTASVGGVDIQTVGVILMIAGAIGLVFSLFYARMIASRRPRGR